jgi:hypothetical protein
MKSSRGFGLETANRVLRRHGDGVAPARMRSDRNKRRPSASPVIPGAPAISESACPASHAISTPPEIELPPRFFPQPMDCRGQSLGIREDNVSLGRTLLPGHERDCQTVSVRSIRPTSVFSYLAQAYQALG